MVHDYFDLDKQYGSLETLSNKVKILSLSVDYDKSRFNLFKGDPFSAQEMEGFKKEVQEFKEKLFVDSTIYERDLKRYETLSQTYQELLEKYQKLHAAWYPENPGLN